MIAKSSELAIAVVRKLNGWPDRKKAKLRAEKIPPTDTLASFFNTLFFASIKTEESRPIQVRVFYVDPEDPDPDVPRVVRVDRWSIFALKERVPFTVSNLVKLARAADSWSSGIAVFHDHEQNLFVWGLVDQVVSISMAIVQESPATYAPPGIIHAQVSGPADISVFREMSFIARLAQDSLIENQNDCLWEGLISEIIDGWLKPIWDDVSKSVSQRALSGWRDHWRAENKRLWTTTLSRVLINIQRQRHGGAILFCPSKGRKDLSIKYELDYAKVPQLLKQIQHSQIKRRYVYDKIEWRDFQGQTDIPGRLYREERFFQFHRDDAEQALTGAVRFISSMAGVDGLILVSPDFVIEGFGVEITSKQEVSDVVVALSADGRRARTSSASHYGTRHRSMFRYCASNPGAVGFVVSQDGDIRAVTYSDGKILLFENVKIHSFWDDDYPKMARGIKAKRTKAKTSTARGE